MLGTIATILFIVVSILFISRRWNEAKQKRDFAWTTRVGAGIKINEKKPSALPYLFK